MRPKRWKQTCKLIFIAQRASEVKTQLRNITASLFIELNNFVSYCTYQISSRFDLNKPTVKLVHKSNKEKCNINLYTTTFII